MDIIRVEFPTPLSDIKNIEDDNIDVFIELEDGMTYTLVITTPKNLYTLMRNEKISYIPAGPSFVIVESLTEKNIIDVIKTYVVNEAYWLKLNFISGELDINLLDKKVQQIRVDNDL
ncbi:hypothetical protein ACIQXW_07750 [Lysinibacillus sp. NPDC097162]|uniref:hypothetical protein n=1 Tax=Lysinibacillus sp. NPDC097162 TaxID=3364140 RepID=UPI0037F3BE5F